MQNLSLWTISRPILLLLLQLLQLPVMQEGLPRYHGLRGKRERNSPMGRQLVVALSLLLLLLLL